MQILRPLSLMGLTALCLLAGWPDALRAQDTRTERHVLLAQRTLQRYPLDARAYYRLGDAYLQKARESADATLLDLAERALRQALALAPQYSAAARHLAHALNARHAFQEAAAQATRAIALDPTDSHAYGVLGDAALELGHYAQAEAAYRTMLQLRDDFYAYSRLAGWQSLHGDPQGAIATLEHAITLGQAQGIVRESLAWVQWQVGHEYFMVGKLQHAEAGYQAALSLFPKDHRALAGLARVRAAQQRYPEALDLYQRALALLPLPEYAAALGDVSTKLARPAEAAKHYALVDYMGVLNTRTSALAHRELAIFYVEHDRQLPEALALARQELAVRQDIYAYDLLAWALCKNGQPREALGAITTALHLDTQDAKLFFHAGIIYHHLGDHDQARLYLQRALATNPYFHLFDADVAQRTLQTLRAPVDQSVRQEHYDDL